MGGRGEDCDAEDGSFKTFIFNSEEELKDDPSEEEEKSLVGVPL